MATASVHDLKNDLKMMFVKRYLGHGFKLPVIFYYSGALIFYRFLGYRSFSLPSVFHEFVELCGVRRIFNPASIYMFCADECCEDRQLLLTMFKEIESETGARLYDTAEEGGPGVEVLPTLDFPEGKRGEIVFDLRPNSIAPSVVILLDGSSGRGGRGTYQY